MICAGDGAAAVGRTDSTALQWVSMEGSPTIVPRRQGSKMQHLTFTGAGHTRLSCMK